MAIQRTFLTGLGLEAVAARYSQAGIDGLELRVSPLGGPDEGPTKIRAVFKALETLRSAGLDVRLGSCGLPGHAALALGLASGFSVGVGYAEKYNYKEAIGRQRALAANADEETKDDGPRGPIALVRLPGTEAALPRETAAKLYKDSRIRSRLVCGRGHCATTLDGPLQDVRLHYLHSWAGEVAETLVQPSRWRSTLLRDRLLQARDLRETVWKCLPKDVSRPKGGTLDTVIAEIDHRIEKAA